MIVVSDTSPITNLLKIGRLDLLRAVFDKVIIPPAVLRELSVVHPEFFNDAVSEEYSWIRIQPAHNLDRVEKQGGDLGPGETEVLALALELPADMVLLDERKGRRVASSLHLRHTGVIGILLEAKRTGVLNEVNPVLRDLMFQAGFWISPSLYEWTLQQAEEE